MKSHFKKVILYWVVVSQVFLNIQFVNAKDVEMTDDNGETHKVDPATRVNFRDTDVHVGDTFKSGGKSYEVVSEFKANEKSYFLYSEISHHDPNTQKTLIDPNREGGKVLLDGARQFGTGNDTKLDFSNGAPSTSHFSNQELMDLYYRRGNTRAPDVDDMNRMMEAAYNTEMRFYNNYYNELVNQSIKEVGDAKGELENYDTNSKAFSDSPATDTNPDFINLQLDNKPYTSSHALELNQLRDRLNSSISKGPAQWNAKVEASNKLRETDNAYLSDLKELGDILLKTSQVLVDIATDVIPFTSIPKDAWRLLIGKDPATGEKLSPFERVLAGAFLGAAVVTLGGSNGLKIGLNEAKIIAGANTKDFEAAEKIMESAAKLGAKTGEAVKDFANVFKNESRVGKRAEEIAEVASASPKNRAAYEKYTAELRQKMERPHVEDPKLSNIMENQFRPNGEVGSGSTAAAIRFEKGHWRNY